MPTRPIESASNQAVPIEYAGKWVAWSSDHSKIVAHSDDVRELWRIVQELQIHDPIFEKVPRADVRFIGAR